MELVKTYGEGIMKAIIESYDSRYLHDLEDIQRKHQATHAQAMMMGGGGPQGGMPRPPPIFNQGVRFPPPK
jgi:hypothetical protein